MMIRPMRRRTADSAKRLSELGKRNAREHPERGYSDADVDALLAGLIRDAKMEERERCAKIAEDYYRHSTFNSKVRSLGQDTADAIAAAIRVEPITPAR